jgi:hypothetical protein
MTIGTAKMENIPSFNTPASSNPFCLKMNGSNDKTVVCTRCYSINTEKRYPKLINALERNADLYKRILLDVELPRLNFAIARFDSFGEVHNEIHVLNYFNLARKNPETVFGFWTKRKDLIKRVLDMVSKPANVILIHSSTKMNKIDRLPAGYDKVFTAHKKSDLSANVDINCSQSCNDCRLCYSHNDIIFINEIAK